MNNREAPVFTLTQEIVKRPGLPKKSDPEHGFIICFLIPEHASTVQLFASVVVQ
jgi:hypothetical protein